MDQIFIYESLLKRNEIEPFFKRLITGKKWITYDKVRKRSCSKQGEAPQTVAKDWRQEKWCYVCEMGFERNRSL